MKRSYLQKAKTNFTGFQLASVFHTENIIVSGAGTNFYLPEIELKLLLWKRIECCQRSSRT